MTSLTDRQEQVARYVAVGFSDKLIARALGISEDTVTYHIAQIVEKWNLDRTLNFRVQITHRFLTAA